MALNSTRIIWLLQLQRFMPYVFFAGLALTTVLLLIPSYNIPKAFDFYDKAQHGLMFATLTIAGLLAYPHRVKTVFWGLVVYGGLMEVMQSTLTTTRHGDIVDWVADSTGIALGLGLYLLSLKLVNIATNKIAV